MDAYKALDMIEQLELSLAGMYEGLRDLFKDDKELQPFFYHLHLEEVNHANMASMQKRIVRTKPKDFKEVDFNFTEFKKIMDHIQVVRSMPRDKSHEILIQCYLIESSQVEQYVVTALKNSNEDVRQLLEMLTHGFRDHLTALAARVKSLGVDIKQTDAVRNHPRVAFSAKATINERTAAKSVDISENGIFLLGPQTFPEKTTVTVSFPIMDGVVTTKAIVRSLVPNAGLGLQFHELSEKNRALISAYVDQVLQRAEISWKG